MRFVHKRLRGYVLLGAVLLLLLTLSKGHTERLRGMAIAALAPFLQQANPRQTHEAAGEIQRLRSENRNLSVHLMQLQELLQHEVELRHYVNSLKEDDEEAFDWLDKELHNRPLLLKNYLALNVASVPAKVLFRSPGSWNSTLWINVGSENNSSDGKEMIAMNSPVLSGESVVGVIDYVGKKQSRVRLITDSLLTPSVRAVRKENGKIWYLAKGELHGSDQPLWRGRTHVLQGVGFNYDFADAEGPARDLRSGEPEEHRESVPIMSIIQPQDLLITTGMDGVFPAGLTVGQVTAIQSLKEGDYYYTITAVPTASNLDDLSLVFVLPPLSKEEF